MAKKTSTTELWTRVGGLSPQRRVISITNRDRIKLLKRTRQLLAAPGGFAVGVYKRQLQRKRAGNALGLAFCINGAANYAFNELFGEKHGFVNETDHAILEALSVNALARAKGFDSALNVNDADSKTRARRGLPTGGQAAVVQLVDEKLTELGATPA